MESLPLRLSPGADLRASLEDATTSHSCAGAFVVSGIGSLRDARLRLAGAREPDWSLTREPDPATGFAELVVQRKR